MRVLQIFAFLLINTTRYKVLVTNMKLPVSFIFIEIATPHVLCTNIGDAINARNTFYKKVQTLWLIARSGNYFNLLGARKLGSSCSLRFQNYSFSAPLTILINSANYKILKISIKQYFIYLQGSSRNTQRIILRKRI